MAKFYGITNKGKHVLQIYTTLPTWTSADEGRIIYVSSEQKCYYATSTAWVSGIGVSGYSGYSGLSGVSGNVGDSGYSGYRNSGYSAYSGYSGIDTWDEDVVSYDDGYLVFPNGLIMNFGYYHDTTVMYSGGYGVTGQKAYTITFKKPFTTCMLFADAALVGNNLSSPGDWYTQLMESHIHTTAKTQMRIYLQHQDEAITKFNGFLWMAIGY